MTRDEARILMRQELERDLTPQQRQAVLPEFNGMNSNDLMDQVDKNTKLGNVLLDEFIIHKNAQAKDKDPLATMDQATLEVVLTLMQEDVDIAPPGWADTTVVEDDNKRLLTPKQVMEEVRNATEWGTKYAETWLSHYHMMNELANAAEMIMFPEDKNAGVAFSLGAGNKNKNLN
jgi:hypothetical protein